MKRSSPVVVAVVSALCFGCDSPPTEETSVSTNALTTEVHADGQRGGGYCLTVTVRADDGPVESWDVTVDPKGATITSVASAVKTISGALVHFGSFDYNRFVVAGASTAFSFCGKAGSGGVLPVVVASTSQPDLRGPVDNIHYETYLRVKRHTTADWGLGYCADVEVSNNGPEKATWSAQLDFAQAVIEGSWGAKILGTGALLTFSGMEWNRTLVPGAVTHFGFCARNSGPRARVVSVSGAPFGTDAAGLTGTYFASTDLSGNGLSRIDRGINFIWADRGPSAALSGKAFSVRWTGSITATTSEKVTLTTTSLGGLRLWINGQLLVDEWANTRPIPRTRTAAMSFVAGQRYEFKLESTQSQNNALVVLEWQSATNKRAVVPASAFVTAIEPGDPGAVDVAMNVRWDRNVHAIAPEIYGINYATGQRIDDDRLRAVRFGGNRLSAYNWENNASNAGNDHIFQNDGYLSASDVPGAAVAGMLGDVATRPTMAVLTVPISDYVSADKNADGDVRTTPNYLQTRFMANLADHLGPLPLIPDVSDRNVYQSEFVNWAATSYPTSKIAFSLDNEPDIWFSTHAEIWPTHQTYDDVVSRNAIFGAMIKNRVPGAKVVGYGGYGWHGFDTLQDAPDATTKGRFVPYYLDQMRAAEAQYGKRVVDYMDIHWYPEAQGDGQRITGDCVTAGCVVARVQAPRSLWDATYTETSWITQWSTLGPINLLGRMKQDIADHYPGTILAINEWNYGAGSHISGGIATADVLGILGREGVGMANNWLDGASEFLHGAYKIFGNYDMKGSGFGDTSIESSTNDVASSSVYGAYDAANPNRVTIVAINKSDSVKTAGIRVAHPKNFKSAQVYVLSTAGWSQYWQVAHPQGTDSIAAVATNTFSYAMPASSVSIIIPSTEESVAKGPTWPAPPPTPAFGGWTFDADTSGWAFDGACTGSWDATVGDPSVGSLRLDTTGQPWDKMQAFINEPGIDLTHKKLTLRIKSDGNFQGNVMFFVMTRWADWSHYDWKAQGWATPGTEWMTMTFDMDEIVAQDPDFNPALPAMLGIQALNTTSSATPTTLWVDTIQYPL
jgi:hypothetical protein